MSSTFEINVKSTNFYTPVFIKRPSSDGTYYGMVMSVRPGLRPTLRPSIRLSVRPSDSPSVRVSRLQTGRIMVWWCPSVRVSVRLSVRPSDSPSVRPTLRPSGSPSARFPHFSPTCFDTLSWNFAHDFVLMYYRSSLSVVNLRQVLLELCPFWNLKYWKYTVFRTFLLHALTYWVEILHMTLFNCTTDQVWVSSICVNFCGSYAPFGT